jgi:zinc finger SWIM domain-containing protein 3
MTGVLWCDFQSQMDYRAFGDVIVFDGTYKTNKYNLPLVPFVGVCRCFRPANLPREYPR